MRRDGPRQTSDNRGNKAIRQAGIKIDG